jgi:hypothetical protein
MSLSLITMHTFCSTLVSENLVFKLYTLVTFLRLSLCVLYSIKAVGGRCRTRRKVSLILCVVETSDAVLFHKQIISS